MHSEYVYILTNESYPNLLKIGYTSRPPEERCAELSSATGVPTPFKIAYQKAVSNGQVSEQKIHSFLNQYRKNKTREFFELSTEKAIAAVNFCTADDEEILENSDIKKFTGSIPTDIINVLKEGQTIQAIKQLRADYNISLMEAKNIIDQESLKYNKTTQINTGCFPIILLAIMFFFTSYFFV